MFRLAIKEIKASELEYQTLHGVFRAQKGELLTKYTWRKVIQNFIKNANPNYVVLCLVTAHRGTPFDHAHAVFLFASWGKRKIKISKLSSYKLEREIEKEFSVKEYKLSLIHI